MIKLNKKNSLAFAIVFAIAGVICLIFSKTSATIEFLSCVFFGGFFVMIGKYSHFMYFSNLIKLDKNLEESLKDAEINGEASEYYGFDEEAKNKILRKYIKKYKYKYVYFYIFAAAMFVLALFILF